jgi:hypothetical protein
MIIVKVFVAGSIKLPAGNLMFSVDMEYYLYLLIGYEDCGAEFAEN